MNYAKFVGVAMMAVCLGVLVFFFLLEHDQSFKTFVEKNLKIVFLENFSCTLEGTVKSISLLGGSLELHDVITISQEKDLWQWRAKKFNLRFSWLNFFITRTINLTVQLEGVYAQSRLCGTDIGIMHHLLRLMGGAPGFPIGLEELQVKKGSFLLQDFEHGVRYTTNFFIHASMFQKMLKLDLKTVQGCIAQKNTTICKEWACTLGATIKNINNPLVHLNVHGSLNFPDLVNNPSCSYALQWHDLQGSFLLKNNDESLSITADQLSLVDQALEGDIKVRLPLTFCQKIYWENPLFQGHVNVTLAGRYSAQSHLDGLLTISNIAGCGLALGDLVATFGSDLQRWFGDFSYKLADQPIFEGSWFFDRTEHEGRLECSNTKTLSNSYTSYVIPEHKAHVEIDFTPNHGVGLATVEAQNERGASITGNAQMQWHDALVTVSATCNAYTLQAKACMQEQKQEYSVMLQDPRCTTIFSVAAKQRECTHFHGFFTHDLLKAAFEACIGYKISGEGIFLYTGTISDTVDVSLTTKECNIRIPTIYNLVRGVEGSCSFDIQNKKLIVHEGTIQLDRGSLETKRVIGIFDDTCCLSFAYIPCRILKTLLTFQKDIFALFSGNFIFAYKKDTVPSLKGVLILERGYIKKNIFSFATQQQGLSFFKSSSFSAHPFDCLFDLHIETKDAVPIKTSFLDASARMNLDIKGSVQNPLIAGEISIERGSLAFPYKPLTLSKARIYFVPHQPFDPYFELIAKGMIRKYHVALRCDGSLQNPRISFESSPPLTEEQIITLLLAGSEEGSLSVVMPSVLMQGIQSVLFGPEQTSSRLERYFKDILGPFKHIRFVPKFFDPQGRGGFRGAIEVDVNDQLHGIIQRNFSLPEDIKLEVEYFFADDSALRVIRDERGDFGGEVEMRWKF